MGTRTLEYRLADRHIFSRHLRSDAAYCILHILDGASIRGFISYLAIFVLIFIGMWIIQFIIAKHNVDKINRKLGNAKC